MKKIIFFFALLSTMHILSQNVKRVQVSGKIIVESNDISGITIFNISSNKGVITDENGEFKLRVAANDLIEVSALQYQNINFKVNEAITESKSMKLFLIEEVYKLEEIVVSTKGLSGNLNTDIKKTNIFKPKLDALYFGIKHSDDFDFKDDYKSKVKNIGMNSQRQTMINGLNIVNVVDQLLLPLFRSKVSNKKESGIPDVPVESIKYYFGSEFLVDNFNIPDHRVEEFIRFVESKDFNFSLLNYGKEMEFLELLNKKSVEFLSLN
ncbi:carboxypeptidase-like regulatory domain-containing protein [Flavivirga spongiicola]|uniref:Carboxypeptidase-like regulatory domain-containing protein n=1 Tax=Flavivirga spongiicola TaxID=421621 RepID=A0ABU7XVW7_9FLAO|nr:carboxypeptidase-like regulatory domain-containing protein [Flavivirga sp. MEBiC05379]MDO5979914.1 carboxypeptidase-like regulatory domain-containing protein [Flavivirga sp. MEBiC05379]